MKTIWMGRVRVSFLFAFAVLIAACGGLPSVEECNLLVVDYPHGGRRIMVEPDGSGRYAYGALPALGNFKPGTFDFEEVYARLNSVAERNRRESTEEFGTVQCLTDGESESILYFSYDRDVLIGLLAVAFENRVEQKGSEGGDALQTLHELWIADEEGP